MTDRYETLDQLGTMKGLPKNPDEAVLERVKNPVSYTHLTLPTTPYV